MPEQQRQKHVPCELRACSAAFVGGADDAVAGVVVVVIAVVEVDVRAVDVVCVLR